MIKIWVFLVNCDVIITNEIGMLNLNLFNIKSDKFWNLQIIAIKSIKTKGLGSEVLKKHHKSKALFQVSRQNTCNVEVKIKTKVQDCIWNEMC